MKSSVTTLAAMAITVALVLPVSGWAGSNVSTVNKAVRLDSGSSAGRVQSVNGAIRIGADSVVTSIESVNGGIELQSGVQVERDVEAVNGAIELDHGSAVGGSVQTVNGGIKLYDTQVGGDVETINGGVRLLDNTEVQGNVVVRKPKGWSSERRKPVKVEVGEGVRVHGDLIFEQPVELRLHDSANVGEVIGEDVTIIEG